ncbi:hypothetical protein [Actinoplanes philippinensis]|uniref:hypothetical protein n=1 Tax=Actinoplanes philippinensis TaxID=35752 RepID=UPI0033D82360
MLISIFWPVALAVVVEVFARVPWPRTWWAWLVRVLGLAPVAAVAAVVSYRHLSGLLSYYGEDPIAVRFGPIAVDGLMLISTVAIIVTGQVAATRIPESVSPAVPVALPIFKPRPIPVVVPAGARTLPLVALSNSQANPEAEDEPLVGSDEVEPAEEFSEGELIILPPPPGGRPAAETRRLYAKLAERAAARGEKLTQNQAAEMLKISRWTLRDALKVTADA